jgi:hypothetical protein
MRAASLVGLAAVVLAEAIPYDLYVNKQPRSLQTSKPRCMDFSDLPSTRLPLR